MAGAFAGRLAEVELASAPLLVPVAGVPADRPPVYRLPNDARDMMANRTGWIEIPEPRKQMILAWARARGRCPAPRSPTCAASARSAPA